MSETVNQKMAALLSEKESIENLEQKVSEGKEKLAKLALEIEEEVGTKKVGNILFEGKYYQIRRRKGSSYVCGPRNTPFGSWRKKNQESE